MTFLHPRLARAPIVEAIAEIRVAGTLRIPEPEWRHHVEGLLDGFTFLDSPRNGALRLEFGAGASPRAEFEPEDVPDLRFRGERPQRIVRIRPDLFALSQLGPYTGWETFAKNLESVVEVHRQLVEPTAILRIGLRFLNRIARGSEGEEPLRDEPRTHPELGRSVASFIQDSYRSSVGPYQVTVTRAPAPSLPGETMPATILDLDAFTLEAVRPGSLGLHLENLRMLKNRAFFGSLTASGLSNLTHESSFRC